MIIYCCVCWYINKGEKGTNNHFHNKLLANPNVRWNRFEYLCKLLNRLKKKKKSSKGDQFKILCSSIKRRLQFTFAVSVFLTGNVSKMYSRKTIGVFQNIDYFESYSYLKKKEKYKCSYFGNELNSNWKIVKRRQGCFR